MSAPPAAPPGDSDAGPGATPAPDGGDPAGRLAELEALYRQLVESASDIIFRVNRGGYLTYANPATVRVTGYPAEQLLGMHFTELVRPDYRDRLAWLYGGQIEKALPSTYFEFPLLTRDGREVWLGQNVQLVWRGREVGGVQGVARNITDQRELDAALERSERYYRSLIENTQDLIHLIGRDETTRYLSPAVARLLGYSPAELLGRPAADLLHPDDVAEIRRLLRGTRSSREPLGPMELRVRHRDGSWRTYEAVMRNLVDDPAVQGVVVNSRDVTERKRAAEENQRLAALSRENPNPVVECAPDGAPVRANPAAERAARELGLPDVRALFPADHARIAEMCAERGQSVAGVESAVGGRVFSWIYHPHGPTRTVHLFATDITGRREMEEQLRHDALHDALTGLPNRLLFMERLSHAALRAQRKAGRRFAVLFLDLDRFKVVNDSLGHHVGDELLQVVADRLRGCLRPSDTVARFGGDEFAVLLEEVGGAPGASRVAERIQAAISAPVVLNGFDVFVSASIGIALDSIASGQPEYLVRNADMAMYRAKAAGPGRFEVFDRAMHAAALDRLKMETDLRHALERDEIRVHYQPIACLETGRLVALEALARWHHPERGLLEPERFIPLAEETGAMPALGTQVLREACRQVEEWRRRVPERASLGVTVNLSAKQLARADLVEQVRRVLGDTGLAPRALKLEVTESAVMENADASLLLLEELKRLGVRIYLDDFGTGYSSLSYLHRFPLDAVKIDRSFVAGLGAEERAGPLVESILALSRTLGVTAVAEGIETPAQLAALQAAGCAMGQGILLAGPLPPEQVEPLLAAPTLFAGHLPEAQARRTR